MNIEIATLLFCVVLTCCSADYVNDRYYPMFHLAPPHGWMNDPNGFCYFNGTYHMFYQFNPKSSFTNGIVHWGHAKSVDLFHWEHLQIAMYPDEWYDETGVFSGSALIENGVMYLYYTGNVNITGDSTFMAQYQALATSTDGVNVAKYVNNPIIYSPDYQPNIRDPKVWKHNETYYMILGNSYDNGTKGQALLYKSKDKYNWEEMCVFDRANTTNDGYMWECNDAFMLNGKFIHISSPQGIPAQGDNFWNTYATTYTVGDFDYDTCVYTKNSVIIEIDHGHDFYAAQTMLDLRGRRILSAWINNWNKDYPDRLDGWAGLLTIPRTLTLTDDLRLLQTPVEEINTVVGMQLYSGRASTGKKVILPDNAAKVELEWSSARNVEVLIESQNKSASVLIKYNSEDGRVVLDRGGDDGIRRTHWDPRGQFKWVIYIDRSSVELFCGDGEVTFTSRYFPYGEVSVLIGNKTCVDRFTVHTMQRTVPVPDSDCYFSSMS